MANEYVRRHEEGDHVPREWSVVTFPADGEDAGGTYQVYGQLGDEMRKLIARGDLRSARTLLFWFDTGD